MKLLGSQLTKISADKSNGNFNGRIDSNVNISDVKEASLDLSSQGEKILAVEYNYKLNYSENVASLLFEGKLIVSINSSEASKILENWKTKKLDDSFRLALTNLIIRKNNVKALQLEEDLNLPPHFPIPPVKMRETKN